MKVSASIELVWQLAAQEAIASEHKEIEPEHFLAALLKFAELPGDEIEKQAPGSEAVKELVSEVGAVQREFEDRSIDTTLARRELRANLGKGNSPYDGGQKHRSKALRDLFDAAARLADDQGSPALVPQHLLAAILGAPTPVMAKALGRGVGAAAPRVSKTPLLDEYGQNLKRQAGEGKLTPAADRHAEAKTLLDALGTGERRSVLLVSDAEEDVRAVVVSAACMMAGSECPRPLKTTRIADVSDLEHTGDDGAMERLGSLLNEAATVPDLVVWLPAIGLHRESPANRAWVEWLKARLGRGSVRCICRVSPAAFRLYVEKDLAWRRLAQVMWIHDRAGSSIPDQL